MEELINDLLVNIFKKVNFIAVLEEMNCRLKDYAEFNLREDIILREISEKVKIKGFSLDSKEAIDVMQISRMLINSFSYHDLRVIVFVIMALWGEVRDLFNKVIRLMYIFKEEAYQSLYLEIKEVVNGGVGVDFLLEILSQEYVNRAGKFDVKAMIQVVEKFRDGFNEVKKM